ncbi:MAG: DsbA family protein [Sedimenticola sp.]
MNYFTNLLAASCLLFSVAEAVSASPKAEGQEKNAEASSADQNGALGDEYQKLLEMVKSKRAPVQEVSGDLDIAGRPGIGPKDAAVILVEFGDFECPYCRRHLTGAAQEIREKLVSSGRLRYVFLDYPIESKHPLAAKAAAAARCAEEQGKYWEMRNTLYTNQKALHAAFLESHAESAGLDKGLFSNCLSSGRYDAAIRQDQVVGSSLGIKGTPTFFLGVNHGDRISIEKKIMGAQPFTVFEREILQLASSAERQISMGGDVSR